MRLKGRLWKTGKPVSGNTLYELRTSQTVPFEEMHEDGSRDTVDVEFQIKESQRGFYAKEYRPPFIDENGCRKADILTLVIDETQQRCKSSIYDVKADVGGEDVIFKLIEQWCDSIHHKNSLIESLRGYEETQEIGVITRQYDEARIRATIDKKTEKRNELTNGPDTIAKAKVKQQVWKLDEELKKLTLFQEGKFTFYSETYSYAVHILRMRAPGDYHYDLRCDLG